MYNNIIGAGVDYEQHFSGFLRSFDDNNRLDTFNITIIDDDLFEFTDPEELRFELRFNPGPLASPPHPQVTISPNASTVRILDDDSTIMINKIM